MTDITSTATVSSKFQICIPAKIRKELKIDRNSEVMWIKISPGEYLFTVVEDSFKTKSPLALCGILKDFGPKNLVDEFIKEKRAETKKENL